MYNHCKNCDYHGSVAEGSSLLESDALSVGEWLLIFSKHLDPPRCQDPVNHLIQHHIPVDLNSMIYLY
jgi:hypothetical protein